MNKVAEVFLQMKHELGGKGGTHSLVGAQANRDAFKNELCPLLLHFDHLPIWHHLLDAQSLKEYVVLVQQNAPLNVDRGTPDAAVVILDDDLRVR